MPAKSIKQQRFMGMDLARAKAGQKTKTGMSSAQLSDFASTPQKGLPVKVPVSKKAKGKMRGKNISKNSIKSKGKKQSGKYTFATPIRNVRSA